MLGPRDYAWAESAPGARSRSASARSSHVGSCEDAHRGRRVTCRAMTPTELRDHCLSFAGAEETFPFGPRTSVFKVAGKMFALSQLGADSLRVSLKCEPELAEALRAAYAAVT